MQSFISQFLSHPTGWPWKTEVQNIEFQHGLESIKPHKSTMKYHKPNEATHGSPHMNGVQAEMIHS